jgi:hypothetical protein
MHCLRPSPDEVERMKRARCSKVCAAIVVALTVLFFVLLVRWSNAGGSL